MRVRTAHGLFTNRSEQHSNDVGEKVGAMRLIGSSVANGEVFQTREYHVAADSLKDFRSTDQTG